MDWVITAGLVLGGAGLAVFAGWRGAKPSQPALGPRLAPWRLIMVLSATLVMLALVHAVNLLGIETGRR